MNAECVFPLNLWETLPKHHTAAFFHLQLIYNSAILQENFPFNHHPQWEVRGHYQLKNTRSRLVIDTMFLSRACTNMAAGAWISLLPTTAA